MEEINKDIINNIVDNNNFGYLELEYLADDIKEYIELCKEKGVLIVL